MILEQIRGSLHVDEPPAEFIVGTRIATVVGGVDQQAFQRAGAHGSGGKQRAIILDQQGGRTTGIGGGHAGAAVVVVRTVTAAKR